MSEETKFTRVLTSEYLKKLEDIQKAEDPPPLTFYEREFLESMWSMIEKYGTDSKISPKQDKVLKSIFKKVFDHE